MNTNNKFATHTLSQPAREVDLQKNTDQPCTSLSLHNPLQSLSNILSARLLRPLRQVKRIFSFTPIHAALLSDFPDFHCPRHALWILSSGSSCFSFPNVCLLASTRKDRVLPFVHNTTSGKLSSKKSIRTFRCLPQADCTARVP